MDQLTEFLNTSPKSPADIAVQQVAAVSFFEGLTADREAIPEGGRVKEAGARSLVAKVKIPVKKAPKLKAVAKSNIPAGPKPRSLLTPEQRTKALTALRGRAGVASQPALTKTAFAGQAARALYHAGRKGKTLGKSFGEGLAAARGEGLSPTLLGRVSGAFKSLIPGRGGLSRAGKYISRKAQRAGHAWDRDYYRMRTNLQRSKSERLFRKADNATAKAKAEGLSAAGASAQSKANKLNQRAHAAVDPAMLAKSRRAEKIERRLAGVKRKTKQERTAREAARTKDMTPTERFRDRMKRNGLATKRQQAKWDIEANPSSAKSRGARLGFALEEAGKSNPLIGAALNNPLGTAVGTGGVLLAKRQASLAAKAAEKERKMKMLGIGGAGLLGLKALSGGQEKNASFDIASFFRQRLHAISR